ncbi:MAG: MotA/TolQ/ExbB proton channel family protein [Akkermansia sp.]|nr:MotA/TolQ/ExbB proton channel family protein [Akkermansia sp.]MDO4751438.1 MotA/TolQ/ExbB proton channel family protein [Akkermansia sp.]
MINTIQHFIDACHPFGYPLITCSVILVAAIFYHLKCRCRGSIKELSKQLLSTDTKEREIAKKQACAPEEYRRSAILFELAYLIRHKQEEGICRVMESRLRRCVEDSRAGMSTIAVITNIAPMLGILGTAWGLVDIFGVFGTAGAQEGIALGISKALYTTIFGLAIAVPGIIAQTLFERALERQATRMDEEFTHLLANRDKL